MLEKIHWLGHASFRIDDSSVIYIDPWKLGGATPAGLVLVTHGHRDHLSVDDIARIATPETIYVCPPSCAGQLHGDVRTITPGKSLAVGEVVIDAVPSYNTDKPNHPKAAGNVGYVVEVEGQRIYHAGDTDLIPEMSDLRCDIALLPIGGTYTMNADEAALAVKQIMPRVVIPMHWGDIVGTSGDVDRFKQQVPEGVEVVVLKPER